MFVKSVITKKHYRILLLGRGGKMEISKMFMDDMKWGLDNYNNLQMKFRDLWVTIVNKEVVVAGESIKYVEEKASRLTGKRKEEIPVIFVESGAHVY
jgi:hypothetical protein